MVALKTWTLDPKATETPLWTWRQLQRLQTFLAALQRQLQQLVGYGGMRILAPRSGGDITTAWQTLAPYDAVTVEPYGCSFDITAGTFTVGTDGVWRISLYAQVLVNNSGVLREAEFRLINADTLAQLGQTFIAEIQGRVIQISFTGVYDLSALVGVPIALQVRSDDPISDVVWQQQNVGLDFAGPLPSPPLPGLAGRTIE